MTFLLQRFLGIKGMDGRGVGLVYGKMKEPSRVVTISSCLSIMNQFSFLPNSLSMFSLQVLCRVRICRQLDLIYIS